MELKPFTETDCDRLIEWVSDSRFLMQWAGPGYKWPLDREQLLVTLKRTGGYRPLFFMFKAVDGENGRTVGHIELQRYEWRSGHIARVLIGDPAYRNKGYGTRLVSILAAHAFADLGFELLTLNVYDFNRPAVDCYIRIGFRQVEFLENVREFEGELWSLVTMELRRDEWQKS